jgi:hypothetical protein
MEQTLYAFHPNIHTIAKNWVKQRSVHTQGELGAILDAFQQIEQKEFSEELLLRLPEESEAVQIVLSHYLRNQCFLNVAPLDAIWRSIVSMSNINDGGTGMKNDGYDEELVRFPVPFPMRCIGRNRNQEGGINRICIFAEQQACTDCRHVE